VGFPFLPLPILPQRSSSASSPTHPLKSTIFIWSGCPSRVHVQVILPSFLHLIFFFGTVLSPPRIIFAFLDPRFDFIFTVRQSSPVEDLVPFAFLVSPRLISSGYRCHPYFPPLFFCQFPFNGASTAQTSPLPPCSSSKTHPPAFYGLSSSREPPERIIVYSNVRVDFFPIFVPSLRPTLFVPHRPTGDTRVLFHRFLSISFVSTWTFFLPACPLDLRNSSPSPFFVSLARRLSPLHIFGCFCLAPS